MICRQCGAEISDKAIVCYRCGQATADTAASRAPARRAARLGWAEALTGLLALIAAALLMSRAAAGQLPAPVSYAVAALAAIVLIWRIARRRRT